MHPFDEAYEHLRDAADAFADAHGHRPRVFLAGFGSIAQQIGRKTFASNFFQAGGFEVLAREGKFDVDQAAADFAASGARIAVICSTDKLYATGVAELAPKLKAAGARTVVLAGHPGRRGGGLPRRRRRHASSSSMQRPGDADIAAA